MRSPLLIPSLCSLLLVACATSTGPIPIGKDTYMIAIGGKPIQSGGTLKARAFQEGTEFCKARGEELQVVNTQQADMSFGHDANAEIQFMCLSAADAELSRPKLKPVADRVFEVKSVN
jgi:hypothetical protein